MTTDKQSRSNGLWIKIVGVLLTVIGVLAMLILNDIRAKQDKAANDIFALKLEVAKIDDKLGIPLGRLEGPESVAEK